MGDVAKHEYECFAVFAETFDRLPEFNDKKKSPRKFRWGALANLPWTELRGRLAWQPAPRF